MTTTPLASAIALPDLEPGPAHVGDGPVAKPAAVADPMLLKYRPGLDVARFFAAIWVMLSHAGAAEGGGHAVAVFFVLSGYLIGGQLVKEKRQTGTVALPEFYFKRVTRIWPPYFLVLAGMLLLFVARHQDRVPGFYDRAVGAVTYTYNLVNNVKGTIHPTWVSFNQIWSLSIEEQFYLVGPLVVVLVPVAWLMPASLALTALFLFKLPLYAGLSLGVFLACVLERRPVHRPTTGVSTLLGVAVAALLAGLFAVGQTPVTNTDWRTYLLSAVIVALAGRMTLPVRWGPVLRYLGLMTYSYYLIHGLPVYFLGAAYRHATHATTNPIWFNVLAGLSALPLSYLFVRFVELPCLRRRDLALRNGSPWIGRAPWIAWGLNAAGVAWVIYLATHR